jgi:acyl carrier protein
MSRLDKIVQLVLASAVEFNQDLEHKIEVDKGGDAGLFGEGGALDSLGLVGFIILVEQDIADRMGIEVSLADERAMSQRRSPYKTVQRLAEHILERMDEVES